MDNDSRQWQIFQFYNAYRLLVIAFLFFFNPVAFSLNPSWPISFYYFLSCYAFSILLFSYLTYTSRLSFVFLVVLSLLTDFIYLNALLFMGGTLSRSAGVFLNVALAAFCILKPGKLAVFFASIESIILLTHSVTLYYMDGTNTFFYTGIHGIGFFAVAFTALMLAKRINSSLQNTEQKAKEVFFLQRINNYIIQRLQSGIVFTDEKKRIRVINKMAKVLFEKEDIKPNQHLSDLSETLTETVEKWLKSDGELLPYQQLLKDKNLTVHLLPDPSSNKGSSLIIIEDESRTVQRAQQLKLASLGQFTASISHELRNPLGAISHAVQLLKETDYLKLEDKRLTEIIHNNCDRMNLLIKNVLQISRGQKSNVIEFSAKPFFDQFRKKTFMKESFKLQIEIVPYDIKLFFDKSQLSQLLVIFIENSMKYGKNKQKQVNILIKCFSDTQNRVVLIFSDDGEGVSEKVKDKIYDPFYTTSRTGVGLGLFIAQELCNLNQATLSLLESKKGAAFKIIFKKIDGFEL